MESKNICKFNLNQSSDLICSSFIYESTDCQAEAVKAEQYVIHLAVKGNGRLCCEGKEYKLSAGDLFFVCKGDTFSIVGDEGFEYSYICFNGRRSSEYMERIGISADACVFEGHGELIPFWLDCLSKTDDGNIDLLSESVLLYSLARLKPQEKEHNDVIAKVISITGESFADPALSLSEIALRIGYNSKYISYLFKKQKGIAYTQYLRDLRIKHAIFLMEQGIVSVKNVALLSGFRDALYFSKIFKESEGISPKEFIKNAAQ